MNETFFTFPFLDTMLRITFSPGRVGEPTA